MESPLNHVQYKLENQITLEDSYEFYCLLFAAACIGRHNFDITSNLRYVSDQQFGLVLRILAECRSKDKLEDLQEQLEEARVLIISELEDTDPLLAE